MNKLVKSVIFLVFSVFIIYFLFGVIPKIINILDEGLVKTYLIVFYWVALLSIIGTPQYFTWFTDEEIDLLSPIKSFGAYIISIFSVAFVALASGRFLVHLPLSDTSGLIFTICFWLFAFLILYVPQVFVYEPLKERFT